MNTKQDKNIIPLQEQQLKTFTKVELQGELNNKLSALLAEHFNLVNRLDDLKREISSINQANLSISQLKDQETDDE